MAISSARLSAKTDNAPQAFKAKVDIRRRVLAAVGEARVFDAFAGAGEMYSAVWKEAASYTGCDLKRHFDGRLMFCADNRRVLRAVDLRPFNLFDLDAWGSPFEQALIVAARRKVARGELIGLTLTEGAGIGQKMGNVAHVISMLTGLKAGNGSLPGLGRARDHVFSLALRGLAKRMNCDLVNQWRAMGKTGQQMIYCGCILRGR